ncbi:MAG TPA: glutathione S-transferase [Steroidobacteraceae bacterium]|jgi:glutathione S-transferase|nr:glutathione S-transferase [Steroidobacteraceae bacterium]
MSDPQITLYGFEYSGHAHRVVLLLRMLEVPFRYVPIPRGARRTPEFLKLNPLGQIPLLEDGQITIADSNAILVYLVKRHAPGSQWLPEEPLAAARVQRWLSIAAGELTYGPALARRIAQWGGPGDRQRALEVGRQLLEFMNTHLANTPYLAAPHPTLADLACYSYTAHAPEGGLSLQAYPAVRGWLSRIEALPRFEPMPASPLPPETPS